MKTNHALALIFGCIGLVGCMHTVTGGNPVRSPDQRYKLGIAIHGANAKAYTALTKKRVYLWLGTNVESNQAAFIDKKYIFTASALDYSVHWQNSDEVSVDFYDFGEGVSSYAHKAGMPSNHIATLSFQWDLQTQKFVEKK